MPRLVTFYDTTDARQHPTIMAQATNNTGRSIKAATTAKEVFTALLAQVAAKGSIVNVGDRIAGCEVTQRPKGFLQSNGKLKYVARTNKYLPNVAEGLKNLAEHILKMDVDSAREAAYAISDDYGVVITIWEDNKDVDGLLRGRKFNAIVRQRSYETKAGEARTETFFFDHIMEEVVAVAGTSLNMSDFLLEDDEAEDEAKTKALLNETNDFFADDEEVELTDAQILAQAKKDKAAEAKAAKVK